MKAQQVSIGIITRMIAWGGASGAVLGALFPLLAVILIQLLKVLFGGDASSANVSMLSTWVGVGCMVGLAIGGIAGLLLGLLTGVVLAALTYKVFNPTPDLRRYSNAVQITCIVVGGPAALLLVLAGGLPQYGANGWGAEWSWFVWGVTPTVIATIATWWAGRHVAAWVGATASKTG
ncbi:MAG TPA: hypothetical protein VGE45_13175 [Chloroflexia bacterium]|jgi:hypothetical protein